MTLHPRWGFHDRLLTLRSALANFLKHGSAVQAIYRRWRWQVAVFIGIVTIGIVTIGIVIIFIINDVQAAAQNWQSGLGLTEPEWEEEWNSVLRLASAEPRWFLSL